MPSPKQSRSAKIAAASDLADTLLADPDYMANLSLRIRAGEANHMETLLWHYKFGKPTDVVQQIKDDDLSHLSDDELAAMAGDLQKTLSARRDDDDDDAETPASSPSAVH